VDQSVRGPEKEEKKEEKKEKENNSGELLTCRLRQGTSEKQGQMLLEQILDKPTFKSWSISVE